MKIILLILLSLQIMTITQSLGHNPRHKLTIHTLQQSTDHCQLNIFQQTTVDNNTSQNFELTFKVDTEKSEENSISSPHTIYHQQLRPLVTKFQLKHRPHCVITIIVVQSNLNNYLSNPATFGHPANDRFFFVGPSQTVKEFFRKEEIILKKFKYPFKIQLEDKEENEIFVSKESKENKIEGKKTAILNGRHIPGSALFAPYMIKKNENGKIYGGMHFVFMETVSKVYNFTYDLDARPGRGTGHLLSNGTWTHLMADLVYGKSEFVTVTAPTASRFGVIDMSSYTFTVNVMFYSRHPKSKVKWQSIVYPFTPLMWFLILLSFSLFAIIFYCTAFVYTKIHVQSPRLSSEKLLFVSIMVPFALSVDQDFTRPRGTRFISALWMFFILILSTGYKDQLVGFLTRPQPEFTPRTFSDLHSDPEYIIIFHHMSSTPSMYFKNTANQMHREIAARFQIRKSGQECVMDVARSEKTVCVGLQNQLGAAVSSNLTINSQFEPLAKSSEQLIPFFACFGLKKYSVYTEAFDRISTGTTESGLGEKWYSESLGAMKTGGKLWLTGRMKGSGLYQNLVQFLKDRTKTVKPLEIAHLTAVWGVSIFGFVMSILVFLGEGMVNKIGKKMEVNSMTEFYSKIQLFGTEILTRVMTVCDYQFTCV